MDEEEARCAELATKAPCAELAKSLNDGVSMPELNRVSDEFQNRIRDVVTQHYQREKAAKRKTWRLWPVKHGPPGDDAPDQ